MKYQVRYFLPFGFSFAHVESMRNCILISARRTRSLCPAMHRHRLFPLTAGDMQAFPERVLAPQRALASIGPVLRRCVSIAISGHSRICFLQWLGNCGSI